jgi:hypothetical protein
MSSSVCGLLLRWALRLEVSNVFLKSPETLRQFAEEFVTLDTISKRAAFHQQY